MKESYGQALCNCWEGPKVEVPSVSAALKELHTALCCESQLKAASTETETVLQGQGEELLPA